jgi:hypothetical protein
MVGIRELQESLDSLERLQFVLPDDGDRQALETQLISTKSKLLSHMAALTDVSRTLGRAAELASEIQEYSSSAPGQAPIEA